MTTEDIEALVSGFTWKDFEKTNDGQITILGVSFRMRVGLHLGRPTQVLLVGDKFLRVRYAPEFENFELEVFDLSVATTCLYKTVRQLVTGAGVVNTGEYIWRPKPKPLLYGEWYLKGTWSHWLTLPMLANIDNVT